MDTQDDRFCASQEDASKLEIQNERFCVRQQDIINIDPQVEILYPRQKGIRNIDNQEDPFCPRQQGVIHSEHSNVRQNDVLETEFQDEASSAGQQVSFSDKLVINLEESIVNTDKISRQKSPRQPLPRRRCHTVEVLSTDDGYEASMEDLEREALSDSENPRLGASPVSVDGLSRSKGGNLEPVSDSEFRNSLLEEVLMQKKLALLKSVDVKQFLQSQQAQVLATGSSTSPKNSGSPLSMNNSSVMDNG